MERNGSLFPPGSSPEAHGGNALPQLPDNTPGFQSPMIIQKYAPERVVSLQPSATRTLCDLGLLDRVVACTKYCADVCPETADGSRFLVADSWSAQAEQIVAARPDLVIASVPYQYEAVAAILKAGSRFLGLAPRTLADIYRDIAAIAGVMGAGERGVEAIAGMQAAIAEVTRRAAAAKSKPLVFCEEWGKPLMASEPWVVELVAAAGGRFLGEAGQPTSPEVVATADPDVILAAWCGAGYRVPLEKMVEQRGWRDLRAVKAGRVFCISDHLLNTPASSLIEGLWAIAWAVHPELFEQANGIRRMAVVR
jgi:iron complex transport system substrate-binding protein